MDEPSVNSPFSRHSAQVTEFWSLEPEPRNRWHEVCESYAPRRLERYLPGLAFPLDRLSDRVGNLMISGAEDEIVCELVSGRTQLIMDVTTTDGTHLPPSAYYATVWAHDSGDVLVHPHLEIAERHIVIDIGSKLDRVGFAVFRRRDGLCIDRWEATLIREINFELNVSSGQTLEIHDRRRGTSNALSLGDARSTFSVGDEHASGLDDGEACAEIKPVSEFPTDVAQRILNAGWKSEVVILGLGPRHACRHQGDSGRNLVDLTA